jgi:hypothetical protein
MYADDQPVTTLLSIVRAPSAWDRRLQGQQRKT